MSYRKGADAERALVNRLREDGFFAVRTAGSKSKVDVIAIKRGEVLLIQVKRGTSVLSRVERIALVRLAGCLPTVAVPIVAERREGRRDALLWRLTGTGPQDRTPFTTDQLGGAA